MGVFGTPRSAKEQGARTEIERVAYLVRAEVKRQRTIPSSSPFDMLEIGTEAALRASRFPPHVGELVAKYALLPFVEALPKVQPHVEDTREELAETVAAFGRNHGTDATDHWAEDVEYLWDGYLELHTYGRRLTPEEHRGYDTEP